MEVQAARPLLKTIGFVFGLFCLLMAYASGVRLYEHVLGGRSMPQHRVSLVLDIGGEVFLFCVGWFWGVGVLFLGRRGVGRVLGTWAYVLSPGLVAAFFAAIAATPGARQNDWG